MTIRKSPAKPTRKEGLTNPEATSHTANSATPIATIIPPIASSKTPMGKLGAIVALLQRPEGARIEELSKVTGWQAHSVRGAMSGALKKARNYTITSQVSEAGRVYRIVAGERSA